MLPGAFMSQSFPSPVFSLLLTTRQDPGSMMEILKAIESGDWVLASDQVPPLSRLRAVMGSSVSILNGLEADRLELSFPTTVPSVRGPRL